MKENLAGVWRSFKVFHFSGKVEQHTDSAYIEASVNEQGSFFLQYAQNKKNAAVYHVDQWAINIIKNRRYIYFGKTMVFEVITLEPDDMVLADIVKGEKIFFAKMPVWYRRVEPHQQSFKQLTPGKQEKISKNFSYFRT